ncbi:MAG: glycosyltransferase family 39 protein, partial [Acidobacteria bacterium]|nr:glycosyltransferase family 39 protein [Acidobacteriota bacterium]
IDGKRTPVERVNYLLRGLSVPPGEHRIEFVFRAPSFRNGAAYTLLGLLLLLVGKRAGRIGARYFEPFILPRLRSLGQLILIGVRSISSFIWLRWKSSFIVLRWKRLNKSRWLGIAAVFGLLIYGYVLVSHASYSVGGSDSSGYVRAARSIVKGRVTEPVVALDQFGLPDNYVRIFVPIAYDPAPKARTMAPFYPVGLPLHMAVGVLICGWKYGPYLVNPLAALVSLILIYLVGLELGLSRGFSIAGALMLAGSPTFLYLAQQPMSDVLATCWSLAAIWASLRSRQREDWSLLAGASFGVAFLVRPASVLLLIPIMLCLRLTPGVLLRFCLGGLPLAAIFFAYNTATYGHPLKAGYVAIGMTDELTVTDFTVRFKHYVYWLAMTMSPLPLLGWLGVSVCRKVSWRIRLILLTWFGAFLIFFSCYPHYDAWWYTRFLLPGLPAMIIGALITTRETVYLLKRVVSERILVLLARISVIVLLFAQLYFAPHYIKRFDVLTFGAGELIHPDSCRWADQQLPSKALVVSVDMSGALSFYTDRTIVRWDWVMPEQWPLLKERAAEKGYRWYALLMPQEVEGAQKFVPGKWTKLGMHRHISLWEIEPGS